MYIHNCTAAVVLAEYEVYSYTQGSICCADIDICISVAFMMNGLGPCTIRAACCSHEAVLSTR